ncbi:TetR/AcrR family transcriptional regulator [Deinococcus alpinitundrae]|uniref:TetR/AcrR family transcriptional regulator n=1 Tax=Deinococcus alpinitundrae TaxID=468913 RepID=UPI00137A3271|nr:TetR/AcrR family transcriptional regulator [Deinococcus alpinitundrae]
MNVKPQGAPTHRQRQAAETQRLILDAAQRLFLETGFGLTTIEAIAASAGVGVSTIYAIFTNKRGLLKAIRESWHQTSQARERYEEALTELDPARRLSIFANATRHQWEQGAAMMAIYTSAAAVDAEAAAELQSALSGRRTHVGRWIEASAPFFRSDLEPKKMVAIYLALTRSELYLELVNEWGWSPDEYEHWLAQTLEQQFLPRSPLQAEQGR